MNFEDHEIWNRPVPDVEAGEGVQPPANETVLPTTGRLYSSAGAPAHPDAIVALPNHTRGFVSVAERPEAPSVAATPATPIPPALDQPRVEPVPRISDPAIAEVLAPPPAPTPEPELADAFAWARDAESETDAQTEDPFKDWYAEPAQPAQITSDEPVKTGLAAQQLTDAALRARTQLQDLGDYVSSSSFTPRAYVLVSIIATTIAGLANVWIGGAIGMPFGVVLLLSTSVSAWKLQPSDRWIGWVMPAYIAIAAILIAGQFGSSAPGLNVIGQVLLVATTLISIAPWLAAATAIGAVLPRLRKR